MKNIFTAILTLLLPLLIVAQNSVSVKPTTAKMSKGTNPGFETEIPYANIKDVEKDWKHRLTAGSKVKQSEANGEIAVKGIDNKLVSSQPYNVYCILTATNTGVKLNAWFTYNDTVFFTPGKSDNTAAQRFVQDFANGEYFLAVKASYKKERDKLEKLKDDVEKYTKDQERAALKISDSKRAIVRAQEDIVTNEDDQKESTTAIALQQAELVKARDDNAEIYKTADKTLKDEQDAKKKLQDKNAELHKKIDALNKDIANEEKNIASEKQLQDKTMDAIENQKLLVAGLSAKLKAIR